MQFLALDIEDILRSLWASLCQFVYVLIAWMYDLFMNISRVQILNEDTIQPIYQRFTLILTIVMVFYVTFEVVKYVIEPETFSDKEKGGGKLVVKMILVVVLIAFVPRIFSLGYKFQNLIFDNQVFSKVLLGQKQVDTNTFGRVFSSNILGMFYYPNEAEWSEDVLEKDSKCEDAPCAMVVNMNLSTLAESGNLTLLHYGLNDKGKIRNEATGDKIETYYIRFDGLFAVAVGIFIVYILLMYCVDAGVRVAQLVFLQIVAPIPIIGYLSPKKEGIFQKWTKQCFTTYLDLFIRVGIIYFVLLVCQILGNAYADGSLLNNLPGDTSNTMKVFIYIALIMGLLLFAKKAPQMLGELFPKMGAASGNFGLSGKNRGFQQLGRVLGGVTGGAAGAIAGMATGIAQGARRAKAMNAKTGKAKGVGAGIWGATVGAARGMVGGATRGTYNGAQKGNMIKNIGKGLGNQTQANKRFGNRQENGYTVAHQLEDRARSAFGFNSRSERVEKSKVPVQKENEMLKNVDSTRKQIEDRAVSKIAEGSYKSKAVSHYEAQRDRLKKLEEDPATKAKEFSVGKYNTTASSIKRSDYADDTSYKAAKAAALKNDAARAKAAYEADVTLAKASVNKSNFISYSFDESKYNNACAAAAAAVEQSKFTDPTTGTLDQDAYNKACESAKLSVNKSNFINTNFDETGYNQACTVAANQVHASNYAVAYETQAEADAAYNNAVTASGLDRSMFSSDEEYNQALINAGISKDMYIQGYTTQAEADAAFGEAINNQRKAVDDAKEQMVADYVANKDDGAINTMIGELNKSIIEYNKSASSERRIDYSNDGSNTIDATRIKTDFVAFSDMVKGSGSAAGDPNNFKARQNRGTQEIIEADAEIARIKNETEGSGIGEGKK